MKNHRDHHSAIQKLLDDNGVAYVMEFGGKHTKYRFADGRVFTTASTPSDWRATENALSDLRRLLGIKRVVVHSVRPPRQRNKTKRVELPSVTVMPDPWERLAVLKGQLEARERAARGVVETRSEKTWPHPIQALRQLLRWVSRLPDPGLSTSTSTLETTAASAPSS